MHHTKDVVDAITLFSTRVHGDHGCGTGRVTQAIRDWSVMCLLAVDSLWGTASAITHASPIQDWVILNIAFSAVLAITTDPAKGGAAALGCIARDTGQANARIRCLERGLDPATNACAFRSLHPPKAQPLLAAATPGFAAAHAAPPPAHAPGCASARPSRAPS